MLLTRLQSLELKGALLGFPVGDLACFPASLTRLAMQGHTGGQLPAQVMQGGERQHAMACSGRKPNLPAAALCLPDGMTVHIVHWLLALHGMHGALNCPALPLPCPAATQVSRLAQLRTLRLEAVGLGPLSYAPLLSLPALDRLDLFKVPVPSCLSRLNSLRTLMCGASCCASAVPHAVQCTHGRAGSMWSASQGCSLWGGGSPRDPVTVQHCPRRCRLDSCSGSSEDVAAATEAGLPHLSALNQLVLGAAPAVPAALASLPNLVRFGWSAGSARGSSKRPKPDSLRLPGGAWLASLQELSAPGAMLDASLAELAPAATPSLHTVSIPGFSDELLPMQTRILAWASAHPGLRRLDINWVRSEGSLRALVAAMDRNPALTVGFGSGSGTYTSELWPEPKPS